MTLAIPAGRSRLRLRLLIAATAAVRPLMVRRARAWAESLPYEERRLHLGCGPTWIDGWANIDFLGRQRISFALDAAKPLPFDDGSIAAIFHQGMIGQMLYQDADRHLRDAARVLGPGGVIRIATPDFHRYARSYIKRDGWLEQQRPGQPTALMAVASTIYGPGNHSTWDAETLVAVLASEGLDASEAEYGVSRLDPAPETVSAESLFVEAVKPLQRRAAPPAHS